MSKNPIARTLIEMSGQANVITVFRSFVDFTGSLEAGMLLSQLLYWTPRARDGWIAKSDKDFQEELCLSRYAVRQARSILMQKDILEIDIRKFGGAPTVHYKLNVDKLVELWIVRFQTMDCTESDDGLSESIQSLTEITTEITTETLACDEKNCEGGEVTTADELRKRTEEAVFTNIASHSNGDLDLSKYPEDVRPIIDECHRLWGISPPIFSGRANKNSRAAYWITSSRDLKEACAEFGLTALREYRKEFEDHMRAHKGLAPHTVSSPASLVNPVCGMAGKLRLKECEVSQDNSATQGLMGKVRIGDKLYMNGKEVVNE